MELGRIPVQTSTPLTSTKTSSPNTPVETVTPPPTASPLTPATPVLVTPKQADFNPGQFSFPPPTSTPVDAEMLNSLTQILNTLQQLDPPKQSALGDLIGNLKQLSATLAEKFGLTAQTNTSAPATSQLPQEDTATSSAPATSQPPQEDTATSSVPATRESEIKTPVSPTETLKNSLDKLLEMFRNRRLNQELSHFSEEKLQERMRAALQELKQAQ